MLVERVSRRLAMGMPLKIALAGEGVKRAEYKDFLLRHPEMEDLQDVAKQKFLENAFEIMLEGEQAAGNFRWLIELVYRGVVGGDEDQPTTQKPTILGIPEEIVEQMRRNAQKF